MTNRRQKRVAGWSILIVSTLVLVLLMYVTAGPEVTMILSAIFVFAIILSLIVTHALTLILDKDGPQ